MNQPFTPNRYKVNWNEPTSTTPNRTKLNRNGISTNLSRWWSTRPSWPICEDLPDAGEAEEEEDKRGEGYRESKVNESFAMVGYSENQKTLE